MDTSVQVGLLRRRPTLVWFDIDWLQELDSITCLGENTIGRQDEASRTSYHCHHHTGPASHVRSLSFTQHTTNLIRYPSSHFSLDHTELALPLEASDSLFSSAWCLKLDMIQLRVLWTAQPQRIASTSAVHSTVHIRRIESPVLAFDHAVMLIHIFAN